MLKIRVVTILICNDSCRSVLSPRETEVLLLAAQGLNSRQIASKLKVKSGTVSFHKQNIYNKLSVSNVVSAINEAKRLELIQ